MNRPTFFVLVALNVLLIAILAVENYAGTETPVTKMAHEKIKGNEETTDELPGIDLNETSEENYGDLVDRPLFIKGRKPVAEPEPESVPVAVIKKFDVFVWELTGIYKTPEGATAFFSRTNARVPKDNYRKHKIGDELDGWKVSEIHSDSVVLTQTGETKMLPLLKIKTKTPVPVPGQLNANTRMPPQQNIQPVMIPEPQTEASSVEVETDNPDNPDNSENSQK